MESSQVIFSFLIVYRCHLLCVSVFVSISGVRQKLFFPVERGSFLYSVYFVTFTLSVYVSAKRMKVIYEIRLHSWMNRTMENDWQFSNRLCQTSSNSSQATNMKNAKNSMLASRLRSSVSILTYATSFSTSSQQWP